MKLLLLALASIGLFAETVSEPRPVPFELSNNFHAADAQVMRAEQVLSQAKAALNQAYVEMRAFCGDGSRPVVGTSDQRRFICSKAPNEK